MAWFYFFLCFNDIEKKNERELEGDILHLSDGSNSRLRRSLELREVTAVATQGLAQGAFDVLLFWILSHASQALMGLDPMNAAH